MTSKALRLVLAALVALLILPAGGAGAETKFKRLGEDPAGDGPPALDLTYVEAGRNGKDLEIRLGIEGMLPGIGGYPSLPGIQWAFDVKGRVFIAEAYVDRATPAFLLFEDEGDTFRQVGTIEGTYDFADGFISMLVPLGDVGARKGTKIKGAGDNDADTHVHHVGTTITDTLTTTKAFIVP
jgi:hypothetical protein